MRNDTTCKKHARGDLASDDLSLECWARAGKFRQATGYFFRALGPRIRPYRTERHLSQEDMVSYGFSVRHWRMIEAGRPTTLLTLLRICEAFDIQPEQLVAGLFRRRKNE